jgi:hypothetical protein
MGSNLVGKDISLPRSSGGFQAAVAEWNAKGKIVAEELYAQVIRSPFWRVCTSHSSSGLRPATMRSRLRRLETALRLIARLPE